MRAIDSNIVIRVLAGDDPKQAGAARRIFEEGELFLGTTVMLETEWVLRSAYGLSPTQIADALRKIAGFAGLTLEEPALVSQALDWLEQGMDFADALHLSHASHCSAFLSFDRKLARRAKGLSQTPVEAP